MELIDWAGLARTALWVLGLSIVLAALSYASWRASSRGERLRAALARPQFQTAFAAGCALVSAGLAWSAIRTWERVAWLALLLAFLWQLISAARATAHASDSHEE